MTERKPIKADSIEALGMQEFFDRKYSWAGKKEGYPGGYETFIGTLHLSGIEAGKIFKVSYQTIWNWRQLREQLIEEGQL